MIAERKRFVVEIGAGSTPFPASGERVIQDDEHYIGVDHYYPLESLCSAKIMLSIPATLSRQPKRNLDLIAAVGGMLPFHDGSIEEVVFGNIFDEFKTAADNYKWDTLYTDALRKPVIREARRVLKINGRLIVAQVYSSYAAPFLKVKELLISAGFRWIDEDERSIYNTGKASLYNITAPAYDSPYVATFVKV